MRNFGFEKTVLERVYDKGGSIKHESLLLFHNAKRLLDFSDLCLNIHHVKCILILADEYRKQMTNHTTRDSEIFAGGFKAAIKYYKHTIDELIIISAFENYAKGELLRKQFIPHEITQPSNLQKKQKNKPVHLRTYRKEHASIGTKTISATTLLKTSYAEHLNLSPNTIAELTDINKTRNLAHLQLVSVYGLAISTAEAIEELKEKILARTEGKLPAK